MDSSSLRREISRLTTTRSSVFAEKIRGSGFSCKCCGWCCHENFMIRITPEILRPSNAISIFPDDVRRIVKNTKIEWDDVAEPDIYSCLSAGDSFHVIGWILRRNDNRECIFHDNGKCSIYRWRPLICRCYPFFLKEHEVDIMHCEGLDGKITDQSAIRLGKLLKRYEIKKLQSYIMIINQLGDRLKSADLCMLPEDFSGEVVVFDGESVSNRQINRNNL